MDFESIQRFADEFLGRLLERDRQMVHMSLLKIGRRCDFLSIIQDRYHEADAQLRAALDGRGDRLISMTSDERLKLIEEHEQLNVALHLEIESFYTFAKTVLDDAARLIELFFGRIPAKPLSSHDDLTKRLHDYQQEKTLELPARFNDAVRELRREISDFRDHAVAHEQCPRTSCRCGIAGFRTTSKPDHLSCSRRSPPLHPVCCEAGAQKGLVRIVN